MMMRGVLPAVMLALISNSAQGQTASDDVETLRIERVERDATIWADESLAQEYEQTFVWLWDELRARADAYEVFAEFPFDAVTIGAMGDVRPIGHSATKSQFAAPGTTLSHAQWTERLQMMKNAGYRVVQTEWHHATFDRATDTAPAQSTVNFTIHATDASGDTRYDVTGTLGVDWSDRLDARRNHVPATIDATDVRIKQRTGRAIFQQAHSLTLPSRSARDDLLVYDLNGDGLSDVTNAVTNQVFVNEGDFKFYSEPLCRHPTRQVYEAVFADFTGDGHVDYLVSGTNSAKRHPEIRQTLFLYTGDAEGKFLDPARNVVEPGVELNLVESFAVGDIDQDGDLDLYVAQYRAPYGNGQFPKPYYDANDGFPHYMLLNDGHGNFTDHTEASGVVRTRNRRTFGSSFADLDDDGDLDLLLTSDFAGVDVYFNNGTGHFSEVTQQVLPEAANFGMSHTFSDFNGDGRLDFYVTGMASTTARRLEGMGLGRDDLPAYQNARMRIAYGNRMYLAMPDGTFVEPPFSDDVARSGWTWACTTLDFDNDGDVDTYVTNGNVSGKSSKDYCTRFWCHDIYSGSDEDPAMLKLFMTDGNELDRGEISWNGYEHNALFMNRGDDGFENMGFLMGVAIELDSATTISDDFDLDGRPDLLVSSVDRHASGSARLVQFMRNTCESPGNWIGVRIKGDAQVSPHGARILVEHGQGRLADAIVTGDSSRSQHSTLKHFGLGDVETVHAITVRFTDGRTARIENPAVNQYIDVPPPTSIR